MIRSCCPSLYSTSQSGRYRMFWRAANRMRRSQSWPEGSSSSNGNCSALARRRRIALIPPHSRHPRRRSSGVTTALWWRGNLRPPEETAPQTIASASPIAANWRSSLCGSHESSSSRKATNAPRATRTPWLRAAFAPRGVSLRMATNRGSLKVRSNSGVESTDPSSTTINSRSETVCRMALWMARCAMGARFRVGITTATVGTVSIEE